MAEILATLTRYPVKTRLSLTGTIIVARDLAHAKIRERLERGEAMPDYLKNHPVYYAGPAKTPAGYASGSFGPTTAGRMDAYVDGVPGRRRLDGHAGQGQSLGAGDGGLQEARRLLSRLNRRPGGAAGAGLHQKVEIVEYPELGMEAIWKIEVENFPAFIVVDDKGNDFFKELNLS